jgi:hypothetical protein
MTGSHEVRGSIPLGSTNIFNSLGATNELPLNRLGHYSVTNSIEVILIQFYRRTFLWNNYHSHMMRVLRGLWIKWEVNNSVSRMNRSFECEVADSQDIAEKAKAALELVCSGKGIDSSSRYYSPDFEDHVNAMTYRGLEGARQSVELYTKILSDIEIVVEDQFIDGECVTSRFVVTGNSSGRRVRVNGITISQFKNGLIVEDWSVIDTLTMLRQLGVWRSVLAGVRQWRAKKGQ